MSVPTPATSLPAMRRWFVILLAVLLSAQFGWAVAAAYCAHETDDAAGSHFGHHNGTHTGTPSKSAKEPGAQVGQKSAAGDPAAAADFDHAHCHLLQVVIGHDMPLAINIANERGTQHAGEPLGSSHIPNSLDRPNWLSA
ncbi:MAG: hypothetical protein IV097_01855 [Burkholderiaceae bacterium]|nr:hypothetical protein [Burkholderiaceae bacterium]